MKQIFSILLFLPMISFAMPTEHIYELLEMGGSYSNSLGDKMAIEVDADGAFVDLTAEFEGHHYGSYIEFDLDDGKRNEDGSWVFYVNESDCDNPGCANYDGEFVIKKNAGGVFYVSAEVEVIQDDEDLSPVFEENIDLPKNELEKILENACKETYGRTAHLEYYADDYKHSVYCGYSVKSYMKKN